ncbi:Hsp20/alpha crystallin family protein [Ferruginibacter paludis]|uniref:Hsp20/alpha crystallin family protein n=1 Tax=Ferruginibacter paludis TaxID=1310417 RepID=UPI0025B6093B|nr:Hsp20/alpha crystallin family protein [Ferruginibacter paludis]MDN3654286.1 Hsp20/alpha crystallin family protein [Ferruginibacter paludis]
MKNVAIRNTDCTVYPGTYVPAQNETDLQVALNLPHKGKMISPPANVTELADLYKIEVAIPGVEKGNFLVFADDNTLSVAVMNYPPDKDENFRLHEFNFECFKRLIPLPKNIDAEFANAEYRNGILYMNVPKAINPVVNQHIQIVVY